MKPVQLVLTSLIASGLSFSAQAAIIDFQELENNSSDGFGFSSHYDEDGFRVTGQAGTLKISRPQDPSYTGSTSLFNSSEGGVMRLSKIDRGSFDLFSIDLAHFREEGSYNSFFSKDITFTRDGGHSQTFTLDGNFPSVETFLFDSGFLGITSITWGQGRRKHQFDNIQIDVANDDVPRVPTPPVIWLLGSGLLGLMGTRIKNNKGT